MMLKRKTIGIQKFYIDKNGNMWNRKDYSYFTVRKMSYSLIECINCINCSHCIECDDCYNCWNCLYCFDCSDLNNGKNSSHIHSGMFFSEFRERW